jgi:putative hydrolase of HD superfamily
MSVRGLIGLAIARVTQHSFRTAILGCILAALEGVAPQKTAVMCFFQYTQEARVNDLDTSES